MSRNKFGFVFVVAALLFSALVYNKLPAQIATHFNVSGEPDRWSGRAITAFIMPLFGLAVIGIFNLVPRIFPRRENFLAFEDSYWLLANLVVAFLCALHVVVLGRALGWPIEIPTAALLGVGSMFVVLGNVLPRTRSNWFMGIRTPWTLESEHVWHETHKLAGRTFIVGGIVTMAAAFAPARVQPWIAMGALAIGAFIPVIYSYFVWRKEKQR